MRKTSSNLDKAAPENKRRPPGNVNDIAWRRITMHSRLLYAATLAVSLLSVGALALADAAPPTRTEIGHEMLQAAADGGRSAAAAELARSAG